MPIPGFQLLMRPLLVILANGEEHSVQVIRDTLAEQFELTEEELEERLPSGRTHTYVNRVAWALAHLKGAACIESPRRGAYQITDRGQQLLADTPEAERVDVRALNAFKEYRQFRSEDGDEEAETGMGPKWREAIRLSREILADRERFDELEVTYKHEIAAHIRAALDAAEGNGPAWQAVQKAFGSPNNLLFHIDMSRFKDWMSEDDQAGRRALLALKRPGPTADRVDAFVAALPPEVLKSPGAKIAFASFFLMGSDPAQYPMYRPDAIKGAEKLLGWPKPPPEASLGQEYEHHIAFVADFRERVLEAGLEVRDMLDAQSLIWTLMKWNEPQFRLFRGESDTEQVSIVGQKLILQPLTPEQGGTQGAQPTTHTCTKDDGFWVFLEGAATLQGAKSDRVMRSRTNADEVLAALRAGQEPSEEPGTSEEPATTSFEKLASELYVDPAFLQTVVELLEEKRQLIFYGPPGTGKTYMARRLARFLASGDSQRFETVQFHPSYSYEDFVQGYRPRPGQHGNLSYELVDGPLLRLANRAREAPGEPHVLLIDEVNRGNLPRIFGELLFLLEYRDEQIALMYSREETLFALPSNLWILGTMNTADRSIGLIDAALRRRFHFKGLFPGRPPLDGLLEKWLADKAPSMVAVAGYVNQLNGMLRGRFGDHLQVGQSYFMVEDLDERRLERIWEVDIMPFLEDQLFGRETELEQFRLSSIKREIKGAESITIEGLTDADDQADRV